MTPETRTIADTCASTSGTVPPFLRLVASNDRVPLIEPGKLGTARGFALGFAIGALMWVAIIGSLIWWLTQ